MDRIEKFLAKLDPKYRAEAKELIARIVLGDFAHLDVKKLEGSDERYRVRVGRLRIQFTRSPQGTRLLSIGWRDSQTYRI
jgi:mRNA-degrading endonuclease RelE of RelBE toxin-antitoxin system